MSLTSMSVIVISMLLFIDFQTKKCAKNFFALIQYKYLNLTFIVISTEVPTLLSGRSGEIFYLTNKISRFHCDKNHRNSTRNDFDGIILFILNSHQVINP